MGLKRMQIVAIALSEMVAPAVFDTISYSVPAPPLKKIESIGNGMHE